MFVVGNPGLRVHMHLLILQGLKPLPVAKPQRQLLTSAREFCCAILLVSMLLMDNTMGE